MTWTPDELALLKVKPERRKTANGVRFDRSFLIMLAAICIGDVSTFKRVFSWLR